MKPVMVSGPVRIWDYSQLDTDKLYTMTGNNTGNLAFRYAIYKHLARKTRVLPWTASPADVDGAGDIAIIPCANQLGAHADQHQRAKFTEQLQIPVVAIGLGVQSDNMDQVPEIPAGSIRWVRAIMDKRLGSASNISVRGEFTRRILERLGLSDGIEVLGCPSLFISDNANLGRTIASRLDSRPERIGVAAGNPAKNPNSQLERNLLGLACSTGGSYIVQNPLQFVKAARGETSNLDDIWRNKISNFVGISQEPGGSSVTPNAIVFFDVDAWMEDLRKHDLVVGHRIHGVMLAIQAGVPALCIAHDSRTEELCQLMAIPYAYPRDLEGKDVSIDRLMSCINFDPDMFDKNRRHLANKYIQFLEGNRVVVTRQLRMIGGLVPNSATNIDGSNIVDETAPGVLSRIQISNDTNYDRYNRAFIAAAQNVHKDDALKILSFGCSRGDEPLTLAEKYFLKSSILGVDVSEKCILEAREKVRDYSDRVKIEFSTQEILSEYGPYDAIFAMSVLCAWPQSKNLHDINELYSFDAFESTLQMLSSFLKPQGILVIWNSSFRFTDSSVSRGYEPVPVLDVNESGFVKKFDVDGMELEDQAYPFFIFRKQRRANI